MTVLVFLNEAFVTPFLSSNYCIYNDSNSLVYTMPFFVYYDKQKD